MNSRNPSLSQLRTEFNNLPTPARVSLLAGVAAELADKVRGPKWAWALAQFINGIGPAAYWAVGRK